ncbi:MAG: DUF1559 domain-containing protein, partial [Pirellulales bacterium]|nr:DUF1559 domain-containing protein [Pirellulales bacterium]
FEKPWDGTFIAYNSAPNPADDNKAGRSDYAANCGHLEANEFYAGPGDLAGAATYSWCTQNNVGELRSGCGVAELTGVSFERSEISIRHITDGTSKTYMIGEKYLNPLHYEDGNSGADNETWCTGFNNDNFRTASRVPMQDRQNYDDTYRFGSAHPGLWFVAYCDGHVEGMDYDIDLAVHQAFANRKDGSQ